jgi:O-acetyl-ADP-ribose deacetylase
LAECRQIRARQGGCPTGEAVITTGGNLPAKYVIHTVGPVWQGGLNNEPELLANAYRNSLQLAVENQIKTLAFPNISTGVYGFPKDLACDIAWHEVENFLAESADIEEVTFVCFDDENYELYEAKLNG